MSMRSFVLISRLVLAAGACASCSENGATAADAAVDASDPYAALDPRPFGIFPSNAPLTQPDVTASLQALGLAWMRGAGGQPTVFWSLVDPDRSGDPARMSFAGTTTGPAGEPIAFDYDRDIAAALASGVNVMMNLDVAPEPWSSYRVSGSWLPTNETAYRAFVEATVRRYPGVRVWQVGNEPNAETTPEQAGLPDPGPAVRELADFAALQRITYEAAKSADPSVLVALGGTVEIVPDRRDDYHDRVLEALGGCCVDIFDFHLYGDPVGGMLAPPPNPRLPGYQDIETAAADFRDRLDERGFARTRLWITETASPSGTYRFGPLTLTATESQQARDLPKRWVVALASGVEKIFWFGMLEGYGAWDDDYFDHVGLIYDGHGGSAGTPKLAYWAYWQMTRQLDGCRWREVERLTTTVPETRAYRCPLDAGGDVVVAWWDTFNVAGWSEGATTTITVPWSSAAAVMRAAVPSAASGAEVADPATAFATTNLVPSGGTVTLTLGADPVYVRAN
ncbi:MAG: hypothetical protein QME96_11620 [Myxococcota bacterium]|nr:hypothetical protein [Myxococcota bacterium]